MTTRTEQSQMRLKSLALEIMVQKALEETDSVFIRSVLLSLHAELIRMEQTNPLIYVRSVPKERFTKIALNLIGIESALDEHDYEDIAKRVRYMKTMIFPDETYLVRANEYTDKI